MNPNPSRIEFCGAMIHPTALVHPRARLDSTAGVGPYSVIDAGVVIGPNCQIGPQVYITGETIIGAGNQFHAGAVIGGPPQDLKYNGAPTRLRIGDQNVFREHTTVNRATNPEGETIIGSHNFLMQHVHIAHNCRVHDHIIMGGGSMLAGHSEVFDHALISGNCLIHQFCRMGTLALMQGGSAISKDLPPYTVARRSNEICGLNVIGLRRAGLDSNQRLGLKRLYQALFRSGLNLRAAAAAAREQFTAPEAKLMLDFIAASKRGIVREIRSRAPEESPED